MNYKTLTLFVLFLTTTFLLKADPYNSALRDMVVLSGHIKDANTGEVLIGATVYIQEEQTGGISNPYGFYSIALKPGNYSVAFAFLGYQATVKEITLKEDFSFNVELEPDVEQIDEIIVSSKKPDANVRDVQMGVQKLQSKDIKAIPALMGEVDVIKVIQLMPGVQATSEGSSGFSVRGGNPDQNLILLDEATVYNAGHMLGFFSVFNNDAIKDVKLYKGDIPASNGGRLASLLDIRMKDGNSKKLSGSGGIGTISSRLTLEGPIGNEKTSFILSGRRTYLDMFLPFATDESVRKNKIYFYDLNAKINHTLNENNRFFLSAYLGKDVFKENQSKIDFGNQTLTFRWNHVFSPRLFSNLSFSYSNYNYGLGTNDQTEGFDWTSNLKDYNVKADFNYYLNTKNTISFGIQSMYHDMQPGFARGTSEESVFNETKVPNNYSLEHAAYISNSQKIGDRLTLKYGLRLSMLQNMGKGTVFSYDNNYKAVDTTYYGKGDIYNTYWNLEPRLAFTYMLSNRMSLKGSYSRTSQYLHLATNSTATTPLDVWFPSSPNIKPQLCDQFSAGLFRNFSENTIETSVELFYKDMDNTIDFKDHPDLLLNEQMEGELRVGNSWAYGAEFLVKINKEKYGGWISYTWSRSERKVPGVNEGNTYRSPYDKPNDISIVLNRQTGKRGQISVNWVYSTGAPSTTPVGRMFVGGDVVPIYSKRNEERMPDYHRLDVSYTLKSKKKENRKWEGEWNFSIYNAYGRKNAWSIFNEQDENDPYTVQAKKTYLFSIIPSVTYNFKF